MFTILFQKKKKQIPLGWESPKILFSLTVRIIPKSPNHYITVKDKKGN